MENDYLTSLARSPKAIQTRDGNAYPYIERLTKEFPIARQHRRGMQGMGSDFTYAKVITRTDARDHRIPEMYIGCHVALMRLHPDLGERFNLFKEIPVIYSHYDDLRGSFAKQIGTTLRALPPERSLVETGIYWLYTKDAPVGQLSSLSTPDSRFIQLPITSSGQSWANALYDSLTAAIYATDLFDQTGSVVGEQFFGRDNLIKQLRSELGSGKISGLFGLRKTGKTSVLKELATQPEVDQVVVYVDIESTSGDRDPAATLSRKVLEELSRSLQRSDYSTGDIARTLEQADKEGLQLDLPTLERCISSALTTKKNRNISLILLIDEVENLFPHDFRDRRSTESQSSIVNFFSRLRSLHQQNDRFNFLVAGITASILEVAEIYGSSNPLFQLATPHWLPPLSIEESKDLLKTTGKRQGMMWTDGACDVAFKESGGHAVLLRKVASAVFSSQNSTLLAKGPVSSEDVLDAKSQYAHSVSTLASEIIEFNRKFYPDDFGVLELINSGTAYMEAKSEWPDAIQRLSALGLIVEEENGWSPSRLLSLSTYGKRLRREPARQETEALLELGESSRVEYKGSFEADLAARGIPPQVMHWNCVKAVLGFLNREGGTVLIGVSDGGDVLGIDADLELYQNNLDRFQRKVNEVLSNTLGDAVSSSLAILYESIYGHMICRIDVPKSQNLVFLKKDFGRGKASDLYVRRSGETKGLSGIEIVEYHTNRQ